MKIKVIFTGGTISSDNTSEGITVDDKNYVNKQLIQNYNNITSNQQVDFEISQPINVLSENMSFKDINLLLCELKNTRFSDFDGIIITHGTDTLAYTSNFLSILLAGISIPVVLVSSNFILSNENSNGLDNFIGAVNFIKELKYSGVYAVYKNDENKTILYLGSRLTQCSNLTNRFSSTTGIDFGELRDGFFIPLENRINPTEKDIAEKITTDEMLLFKINRLLPCVMLINPYTGIDYSNFSPGAEIKAILHTLYHAGTAPVSGENTNSIISFYKTCEEKEIDFYISPLESQLKENYSTTKQMLNSGIKPMYDISSEMSYAKLVIAYSSEDLILRNRILMDNVFFEKVLN